MRERGAGAARECCVAAKTSVQFTGAVGGGEERWMPRFEVPKVLH